jgi:hypothetical protein
MSTVTIPCEPPRWDSLIKTDGKIQCPYVAVNRETNYSVDFSIVAPERGSLS